MTLKESNLYLTTSSNIEWLPQNERTLLAMRGILEKGLLHSKRRYELASFYWCQTGIGLSNRLKNILNMMDRSVYLRKGEERGAITIEWMVYNYHIYLAIYQSSLDVALLLTNEILDLGISYQQCSYSLLQDNRKVKTYGIKPMLAELNGMTTEHRKGKNLLFHQGKDTIPPVNTIHANAFNVADLAKNVGIAEDRTISLLEAFLAKRNKEELLFKMNNECILLEKQLERLFDKLLPHYNKIHRMQENP